jgi:hypothetical protein
LKLINALWFVPNNNKCQHKSIVLFKELPPKKDPIIDFDAAVALLRSGPSEAAIQEYNKLIFGSKATPHAAA